MAGRELTRAGSTPAGHRLARAFARAYAGVWMGTLLPAIAIFLAGSSAQNAVRGILQLRLTPTAAPTVAGMLGLWAHNLPIVAWPLLLTPLGAHRHRLARRSADVILTCWLIANTLPVAAALAAYHSTLLPYIPQLPVEWAGLAAGAGWWIHARRRAAGRRPALAWLLLIAAIMLAAAALETWAVPYR